jgi:sugar phosphate isomerase/epimerase
MKSKLASALYPWSGPGDRFLRSGYREGLPIHQRIQSAAALGILDGVEMVYPFEVNEQSWRDVRQCLDANGLALAALGTTVSSQRPFGKGAFTSRDAATRRAAVDQIKAGLDLCHEMGGERIYFFLGQDGCDYPLEVDYADAWGWLVDGLSEVARHRSDIEICLEYKPFEPRRHIFLNDVGTALHLVNQIGADHVGVLLDTGHALMAGENLGESIWLLHQAHRLRHVHFNDNHRTFDDDMIVGSVHFLPFVEAMYWLNRVKYAGWISLDLFPYRESPDGAVVESIQLIKRLDALVDRIGLDALTAVIRQNDGSAGLSAIYKTLFGG